MKFSKTYITPGATGATKHGENKDCVVRAIANASFIHYDVVHEFLKRNGRRDKRGTGIDTMVLALKCFNFKFVGTFGNTIAAKHSIHYIKNHYQCDQSTTNKSITLGKLIASLPYGRFVAIVRGHAVAIVDGKVIDTTENSHQSQVAMLFQFGELPDSV